MFPFVIWSVYALVGSCVSKSSVCLGKHKEVPTVLLHVPCTNTLSLPESDGASISLTTTKSILCAHAYRYVCLSISKTIGLSLYCFTSIKLRTDCGLGFVFISFMAKNSIKEEEFKEARRTVSGSISVFGWCQCTWHGIKWVLWMNFIKRNKGF